MGTQHAGRQHVRMRDFHKREQGEKQYRVGAHVKAKGQRESPIGQLARVHPINLYYSCVWWMIQQNFSSDCAIDDGLHR